MSTVKFKRSGVKDKKPLASQLSLGEIAINFHAQNPFISTLTSDGTVAEFPSKEGIQGLIDDALEEYQPGGGTVDAYTKTETDSLLSGKSDVNHEHSQYLTTSAASSTYATKTDLNGKADSVHTHSYNDLTDKPTIPSTEGFATKQELGNYQTLSGMSSYLTVASAESTYQPIGDYALASQLPDLTDYALKSEIPDTSNLAEKSEIPDVSYFVTSAFTEATYAKKGDTPTDVYTKSEVNDLLAGKSDSGHTHDYETLTNKPDLSNFATKGEIPDTSNFITSGFTDATYQPKGTYVAPSDLNDYALKSEVPDSYTKTETDQLLAGKSDSGHTHPQYVTSGDVETMMSGKTNIWTGTLAQYQALEDKDDNTIYCITDSNYQYLTLEEAEALFQPQSGMTDYQTVANMSGYVTTSAATETYATKDELAAKASSSHTHTSSDITDLSTVLAGFSPSGHSHSYNDLEDKPTIPSVEGLATKQELGNYQPQSGMTDYQLVSAMTDYQTVANMSGYVTTSAATATYATKTELSGYARVVSISQSDYDTLVSNDQVQQGVLYCIIESSN